MKTQEYYKQRKQEIERLRYDERISQKEIGEKFNISYQRIQQILGERPHFRALKYPKANRKLEDPDFLIKTTNLTNTELAKQLGVPEWLISNSARAKTRHRIGGNGAAMVGAFWEIWAANKLRSEGFVTKLMSFLHPYDILVNSTIRIDVKTAVTPRCPPSTRHVSPQYRFGIHKHRKYDCDFYLLIIAKSKDIFIVPHVVIPLHQTDICMCWPLLRPSMGKYQKYHKRFDLLNNKEFVFNS